MSSSNVDNDHSFLEANNPCAKICTIITGVVALGITATLTVYLGIYGYKNPDPQACWVVRDLHTSGTSRNDVISRANAMGVDIIDGYPIEMHKVYAVWFLWGFWAHVAMIVLAAIFIPICIKKENARVGLSSISCCLFSANMFIWLAFGGIWRFSKAGAIASGDKLERMYGMTDAQWSKSLEAAQLSNGYQVNSGRFMKIYLMLMAWVILLFILGAMVTSLVMCCCAPQDDEIEAQKSYSHANSNSTGSPNKGQNSLDNKSRGFNDQESSYYGNTKQ